MTQHWLSFLMRTKSFVTCVLLFVVTKLSIVYSFPPYVAPAFYFVILFSLFFLFLLPFVLLHLHRAPHELWQPLSLFSFCPFLLFLLHFYRANFSSLFSSCPFLCFFSLAFVFLCFPCSFPARSPSSIEPCQSFFLVPLPSSFFSLISVPRSFLRSLRFLLGGPVVPCTSKKKYAFRLRSLFVPVAFRSRSVFVPVAFPFRSLFVPVAFPFRSLFVPGAFPFRFLFVPDTFPFRSGRV